LLCPMLQVDSYTQIKKPSQQSKSSIHPFNITMERVLFFLKQNPFHCNVD
jgi:hypothetical protein